MSGIAGVCANTGITAPKPLIEPLRRAEEGLECPPRRAPETDSGQKSMVKPYRATFAYLISVSLGLNGSATISETLRGGIEGVDAGQRDAAQALSVPFVPTMLHIIIPQALRSVAPALVNEVITVLKGSSLVATIGLMDVMRAAESAQALTYRAFEPFVLAALIYYVIVMVLTALGSLLEGRLRQA